MKIYLCKKCSNVLDILLFNFVFDFLKRTGDVFPVLLYFFFFFPPPPLCVTTTHFSYHSFLCLGCRIIHIYSLPFLLLFSPLRPTSHLYTPNRKPQPYKAFIFLSSLRSFSPLIASKTPSLLSFPVRRRRLHHSYSSPLPSLSQYTYTHTHRI